MRGRFRYETRIEKVKNYNPVFYNDPQAIQKLEEKIQRLEKKKASIKTREYELWELTKINANIRETKLRKKRLEKLANIGDTKSTH